MRSFLIFRAENYRHASKMNYRDLILKWHQKASKQNDIFSSFVFEYLSFVALIKTVLYSENIDRNAIQSLKRDSEIEEKYISLIQSDTNLKNAWQSIIEELNEAWLGDLSRGSLRVTGWWNCTHSDTNQKTEDEIQLVSGKIHDLADWRNMIEFIYEIRNNLFHGSKNPSESRDQLLVENGYLVLRQLVTLLIKEKFGD